MTSSKTTTATVLYPPTDFNMQYYLSSHMPMVMGKFKEFGMTGYNVTRLDSAVDGSASEYSVQCILEFSTGVEGIQKALSTHSDEVLGDIKNFSKDNPKIFVGDVVGKN